LKKGIAKILQAKHIKACLCFAGCFLDPAVYCPFSIIKMTFSRLMGFSLKNATTPPRRRGKSKRIEIRCENGKTR